MLVVEGLLQHGIHKFAAVRDLAAIIGKAVTARVDAVRPGGVDLRLVSDGELVLVGRVAQRKDHRGQAHPQSQHSVMVELDKVSLIRQQQPTSSSDRICTVMSPVYLVGAPDNTVFVFGIF